jgi:hypothetical protein
MQSLLSGGLLGVVLLTCAAVAALAHSSTVERFLLARETAMWTEGRRAYAYHPGFRDAEDRLLLGELPTADYAVGGIYFVGSSTMQHALVTWELPDAGRVRLLAIKSANVREQFQFLRYLVEEEGLLRAGAGRTRVILGLSHLDMRDKLPGTLDAEFVPALFGRHGLYQYDPATGPHRLPKGGASRRLQAERMRAHSFLHALWDDCVPSFPLRRERPVSPLPDREIARHFLDRMIGGDWRRAMDHQLSELREMIDYLQAHGVSVAAVLLPIKRWNDVLPCAATFRNEAAALCAARHVLFTDLSGAVPDEEFVDHTHLGYAGQRRIAPALAAIAGVPLGADVSKQR